MKHAETQQALPGMGDEDREVLTIDQACQFLQVSRASLYRHLEAENIPVARVAGRYRFSRSKLVDWVQGGGAALPPTKKKRGRPKKKAVKRAAPKPRAKKDTVKRPETQSDEKPRKRRAIQKA